MLYTPGHTDNSYSFHFGDRVFTGDTLLIRGSGRTDFQNGDAHARYESLQRLMRLPEETLILPAHDYKGDTVSTIGEEKRFNPRLQVRDADDYAKLMESLPLPNPKMMDVAVPANIHQGLHQEDVARKGWAFRAKRRSNLIGRPDVALIVRPSARKRSENEPAPCRVSSTRLTANFRTHIGEGGLIHELERSGKTIVFYCAFGERSAMAVQAAQDQGLASARHIEGGMSAGRRPAARPATDLIRRQSVASLHRRAGNDERRVAGTSQCRRSRSTTSRSTTDEPRVGRAARPHSLLAADNTCTPSRSPNIQAFRPASRSIRAERARATSRTDPIRPNCCADDVAAFMGAIGGSTAHVSGLSLGGAIGLWLASKHTERVKTLSLHSCWPKSDPFLEGRRRGTGKSSPRVSDSVPEMIIQGSFPTASTPELYAAKPEYIDQLAAFVRSRPKQPVEAFLRQSDAVIGHDALGQLGKIKAPTQITFGSHDLVTSTRFVEPFRSGVKNSELVIFEMCAHAPIYENVSKFNEETLAFLKRHIG